MKVFVIAMDSEADAVIRRMTDVVETRVFGKRVVRGRFCGESAAVVVSGVGKANAAAGTMLALSGFAPTEVLNVGVCGGFEPQMTIGDLYEVGRAVQYDFDLSQVNGTEIGVLNERDTPYFGFRTTGRYPAKTLATGDHFNDSTADFPLFEKLGVGLRDMEGAAVAQIAEASSIPVRALKCVTNVIGAGAAGQYAANLKRCLDILSDAVEEWAFADV